MVGRRLRRIANLYCRLIHGRRRGSGVEAIPSDMAATRKSSKRRKPPPKRAKRSLLASRPRLPLPRLALEPHHVDIFALALIAAGLFLAGVTYLHWAGGAGGSD